MTDQLLYEKHQGVATITLNRPEKLNAFTTEMLHAWADALLDAQSDDAIGAIVLTGKGRGFCSGGDVNGMGERKQQETPYMRKMSLANRVHRLPQIGRAHV